MMRRQHGAALVAALTVGGMTACGGGHADTLPGSGVRPNDSANRLLTSRGRRYASAMRTAMQKPIGQSIDDAVARGARVFRVPQVVVVDPSSNRIFTVPKNDVHQTVDRVVLYEGAHAVALSKSAKVLRTPQYAYLFVSGSNPDPDPSVGAVRVK